MSYNLDELYIIEDQVPLGTYPVKISDIEAVVTKNGDPMLNVTLEITSGDHEGQTILKRYYLKPSERGFVMGLMDIKKDAIALGVYNKLPKTVEADPELLKAPYAKAFGKERFEVVVTETESKKQPGRIFRNVAFRAKTKPSGGADLSELIG